MSINFLSSWNSLSCRWELLWRWQPTLQQRKYVLLYKRCPWIHPEITTPLPCSIVTEVSPFKEHGAWTRPDWSWGLRGRSEPLEGHVQPGTGGEGTVAHRPTGGDWVRQPIRTQFSKFKANWDLMKELYSLVSLVDSFTCNSVYKYMYYLLWSAINHLFHHCFPHISTFNVKYHLFLLYSCTNASHSWPIWVGSVESVESVDW